MDSSAFNREANWNIVIFLGTLLTTFGVGLFLGGRLGEAEAEKKAVEAGVAKWVIDAKTGQKSFVYVPTQEGR